MPGTLKRPPILVGLPVIPDEADEHTKNALALRNATWINGLCPACGAKPATAAHLELGIVSVTFLHQPDCPVAKLLDTREP